MDCVGVDGPNLQQEGCQSRCCDERRRSLAWNVRVPTMNVKAHEVPTCFLCLRCEAVLRSFPWTKYGVEKEKLFLV